jgi:hypothetical protein
MAGACVFDCVTPDSCDIPSFEARVDVSIFCRSRRVQLNGQVGHKALMDPRGTEICNAAHHRLYCSRPA